MIKDILLFAISLFVVIFIVSLFFRFFGGFTTRIYLAVKNAIIKIKNKR